MKQLIYANKQHEVILKEYLSMNKELIREVANDLRWKNYNAVLNIVIDYHNNYGHNRTKGNWYDWIMIIPINVSVLTNGFLAAIETKRNQALVRSYKVIINELVHDLVDKIEKLEPLNE